MSAATLGIVVETMADDFARLGWDPAVGGPHDHPNGAATLLILPSPGCAGWWSFRLAAATYTPAPYIPVGAA